MSKKLCKNPARGQECKSQEFATKWAISPEINGLAEIANKNQKIMRNRCIAILNSNQGKSKFNFL